MEDIKLKSGTGSFNYGADDQLVAAWMDNQSTKSVSIRLAIQDYVKRNGVGDVLSSNLNETVKMGEGVDYAEKVRIQNEKIENLNEIIEQQRKVIEQYGEFADKLNKAEMNSISITGVPFCNCDDESDLEDGYKYDSVLEDEELDECLDETFDVKGPNRVSDPHESDDCIIEDLVDDTYDPISHMTDSEIEELKVNRPSEFEEMSDVDLDIDEKLDDDIINNPSLDFMNSPTYQSIRTKVVESEAMASKPRNVYIQSAMDESYVDESENIDLEY